MNRAQRSESARLARLARMAYWLEGHRARLVLIRERHLALQARRAQPAQVQR